MREILFRGNTESGEWIEGSLIIGEDIDTGNQIYFIAPLSAYYTGMKRVIPSTVGQYTGLTDKNGKKIFEWDIVRVEYTGVNKGLNGIAEVIFDKCKFALVWGWHKEIVCLADFCNVEFEIIGNIHDNRELLESEVEGLTINMNAFRLGMKREAARADNAKAEAYKEFAERLNKESENAEIDRDGFIYFDSDNTAFEIYDTVAEWCKEVTNNLLKEMVGAEE